MKATPSRLAVVLAVSLVATCFAPPVNGQSDPLCDFLQTESARDLSSGTTMMLMYHCGLLEGAPAGVGESVSGVGSVSVFAPDGQVNFTPDAGDQTTQSETTLAVHGRMLVAGWNDSAHAAASSSFSGYGFSTDGGDTWTDGGFVPPIADVATRIGGDPWIRVHHATGNFYYASVALNGGNNIITVHTDASISGAGDWSIADNVTPGLVSSTIQDKPAMDVDNSGGPFDGRVYVCYRQFQGSENIQLSINDTTGTDQPLAHVGIVDITPVANNIDFGCFVEVDQNSGDLYVGWEDTSVPRSIRVRRSIDGGASFGPTTSVISVAPIGHTTTCNLFSCIGRQVMNGDIRVREWISMAVNPTTGNLHVAYASDPDGAGGDEGNVYHCRCSPTGVNGVTPCTLGTQLNGDGTTRDQWHPYIDSSPSGELAAFWYDRRNDEDNFLIDVYKRFSADDGETWTPDERVTDVSFAVPALCPIYELAIADCYMAEYNHIASDDEYFYFLWGDNRNVVEDRPDPDVFFEKEPSPFLENDDCDGAIDLGPLPTSVTFDNTLTSNDIDDPCGVLSGPFRNAWYSVTGTGALLTATTCNAGTQVSDTKISVFCLDCDEPVCVGGNDDGCGAFGIFDSTVEWCSQEGATYFITVGNFSNLTTPGQIQLDVFESGPECEPTVQCFPTGACCFAGGGCVDGQTEVECEESGGRYGGDKTACFDNRLADGSFEAGTPNPYWAEYSLIFGTPLCTLGTCGAGGGTGPRTGDWWAWFGGIAAVEEGAVSQAVIPFDATVLEFYLQIPVCSTSADYLEVLIDGNQVFYIDGASPLCYQTQYFRQEVDISAYADGGSHTLEFHSQTFGPGVTNFFVDDVGLLVPNDRVCALPLRVDEAQKGSLLVWPNVEIRWDSAGNLQQDTKIELTNDGDDYVSVHLYFVNGDAAAPPVFSQGQLVERGHPGWNNTNCTLRLTPNQATYWSAVSGLPGGCQPFTALDDGLPPGRLDVEYPPNRVLRGFVVGFAVDDDGNLVSWNHLSGGALIVAYHTGAAWEYNAYAFQAFAAQASVIGGTVLDLNGIDYEFAFGQLLLSYYATGSFAFSGAGRVLQLDTDLTLMPVTQDLRQDTCGPVLTKAQFHITNMNEVGFSGTERCVSCWDQTLFSRYARNANYLLRYNLQTDKGKARINGVGSRVCDRVEGCNENMIQPGPINACAWSPDCTIGAALLGVQNKRIVFSQDGSPLGFDMSGSALPGQGYQPARIYFDPLNGPQPVEPPTFATPSDSESTFLPVPAAAERSIATDKN